jgi:hypothetical protein
MSAAALSLAGILGTGTFIALARETPRDFASEIVTTESPSVSQQTPSAGPSLAREPQAQADPSEVPSTAESEPCRNSTNPDCGPFHWDPDPGGNRPMEVSIVVSPETPKAGEPAKITVTASDDATSKPMMRSGSFGDGISTTAHTRCAPSESRRYGAWTAPPRGHSEATETFTHVYDQPGTYTVKFKFSTKGCSGPTYDPYASDGSGSLTISVDP